MPVGVLRRSGLALHQSTAWATSARTSRCGKAASSSETSASVTGQWPSGGAWALLPPTTGIMNAAGDAGGAGSAGAAAAASGSSDAQRSGVPEEEESVGFRRLSSFFSSLFSSPLAFDCVRVRSVAFAPVCPRSAAFSPCSDFFFVRQALARSALPSSRFGWRFSQFATRPETMSPLSSIAARMRSETPSSIPKTMSAPSQSKPEHSPRSRAFGCVRVRSVAFASPVAARSRTIIQTARTFATVVFARLATTAILGSVAVPT